MCLCVCGHTFHSHPLFPLLALLFEKCEQSTLSSDCITSASFDVDIENFVRNQEKEGKPFFSEDPELDNLVRYFCMSGVDILRFLFCLFFFSLKHFGEMALLDAVLAYKPLKVF